MLLSISGILRNRDSVYQLMNNLINENCSISRISLLMTDKIQSRFFKMAKAARAPQAGFTEILKAGILDPILRSLAQVNSIKVNDDNLMASGRLYDSLVNKPTGSNLKKTLIGFGMSEHKACNYESALSQDGILIWVHGVSNVDESCINNIFYKNGAEDIVVGYQSV